MPAKVLAKSSSLRSSEWLLTAYFAYVALISPLFDRRPHLGLQPFFVLLAVFSLLGSLAALEERTRWTPFFSRVRDWLPLFLTLAAFREMELFLPLRYDRGYETSWIRQDHVFLTGWHAQAFIESLGPLIPGYLELCYLFAYGLPAYAIFLLYFRRQRRFVHRFLLVYLTGTLAAYALFPYFPSQPPRLAFPGVDDPAFLTVLRRINLYLLNHGTIHTGVFPSAHVSSAFSAAWALFLLLPERKIFGWLTLAYALSVSLATIYGRYHYAADVLSGFAVSLVAGLLCLFLRRLPHY